MEGNIRCHKDGGTFAQRLVGNLKALNAKERDHLMRLAYLGKTREYEHQHDGWISEAMDLALRNALPVLDKDARCVFAGMDYHLDWLYAALCLATDEACACTDDGGGHAFPRDNPGYDMKASENPKRAATLRPISGRQEDVDLFVVFAHAEGGIETTTLLFIEAKGVGAVDSEQLARKLVRIDRILDTSRARSLGIKAKFVLALPADHAGGDTGADPRHALEHARTCKDEELRDLLKLDLHDVGIGSKDDSHTFVLMGFPRTLDKVTRCRDEDDGPTPDDYTRWTIKPRRRPKDKPESETSRTGTPPNQKSGTPLRP